MSVDQLLIRCYAQRSGGIWCAVCVDLCLAAQAETLQEAKLKLEGQIYNYLDEALNEDKQHAEYLLSRKAPLMDLVKYHAISTINSLHLFRERCYSVFSQPAPFKLS